MSSKRVALLLAALFCLFAVTPSSLFAQAASTGTVAGTVTDPSGGAVAGAAVTLTDTSTNISRSDSTNDAGRYFFANVVPSTYNVSVNKTGFRVSKLTGQVVNVGSTLAEHQHGIGFSSRNCRGLSKHRCRTSDPECYGGQHRKWRYPAELAGHWPRYGKFHDAAAWRLSRWQRRWRGR